MRHTALEQGAESFRSVRLLEGHVVALSSLIDRQRVVKSVGAAFDGDGRLGKPGNVGGPNQAMDLFGLPPIQGARVDRRLATRARHAAGAQD